MFMEHFYQYRKRLYRVVYVLYVKLKIVPTRVSLVANLSSLTRPVLHFLTLPEQWSSLPIVVSFVSLNL
jgi:hypothetical protein